MDQIVSIIFNSITWIFSGIGIYIFSLFFTNSKENEDDFENKPEFEKQIKFKSMILFMALYFTGSVLFSSTFLNVYYIESIPKIIFLIAGSYFPLILIRSHFQKLFRLKENEILNNKKLIYNSSKIKNILEITAAVFSLVLGVIYSYTTFSTIKTEYKLIHIISNTYQLQTKLINYNPSVQSESKVIIDLQKNIILELGSIFEKDISNKNISKNNFTISIEECPKIIFGLMFLFFGIAYFLFLLITLSFMCIKKILLLSKMHNIKKYTLYFRSGSKESRNIFLLDKTHNGFIYKNEKNEILFIFKDAILELKYLKDDFFYDRTGKYHNTNISLKEVFKLVYDIFKFKKNI